MPCPTVLWYTYVTRSTWLLHLLLLWRSAISSSSSVKIWSAAIEILILWKIWNNLPALIRLPASALEGRTKVCGSVRVWRWGREIPVGFHGDGGYSVMLLLQHRELQVICRSALIIREYMVCILNHKEVLSTVLSVFRRDHIRMHLSGSLSVSSFDLLGRGALGNP